MDYLEQHHGVKRFVLVGRSFGGAPVFTVGGADRRVVGCATVASQTAETDGIRNLAPTPVLLLTEPETRPSVLFARNDSTKHTALARERDA